MVDENPRCVRFADLIDPNKNLDELNEKERGYLDQAIEAYFRWREKECYMWKDVYVNNDILMGELPIYRELFKGVLQFTGDADTDLILACQYQLMERSRRFPDHQLVYFDEDSDSVEGLINGLPVSDDFIDRIIEMPDLYGKYSAVSGRYIFDVSQEFVGKNRICTSVVSRKPKSMAGVKLVKKARNHSLSMGEKIFVFTRPNRYFIFKEDAADGIEDKSMKKYVEIMTVGGWLDSSALSMHSRVGEAEKGKIFDVILIDGTPATFEGDGFSVVSGGIIKDARLADRNSEGYCVLGEHKAKRIIKKDAEAA